MADQLKIRHCARCGQVAVPGEVTEDGVTYLVYTCTTHKEVVWKEKVPEAATEPVEDVNAKAEAGDAASSPVVAAAQGRKREPRALNGPEVAAATPGKRQPKPLN
jgi:hypothetical protein